MSKVSGLAHCYLYRTGKLKWSFGTYARDTAQCARHLNPFATQATQPPTDCEWGPSPHVNNVDPPGVVRQQGRRAITPTILKSVWPLFFDVVTPTSQRHSTTPRVGGKSVKELQSLASLFTHFFIASESTNLFNSAMIQTSKPACITTLGGYPD
jgi:hypothetical protein